MKKTKILYNSVLYTPEGITHHAREELKELLSRGYEIMVTDINYNSKYGDEFKQMYNPFDKTTDDNIIIVNQPPYRANNIPASLAAHVNDKNVFYFFAFEGIIPKGWVDIINQSNIRCILTPSKYNKKVLKLSGVKKAIEIMPHGITSNYSFKEKSNIDADGIKLLWCGTVHNNRKGLEYMWKVWNKLRELRDDITLTLKISGVYGCSANYEQIIEEASKDPRVNIISTFLSDEEMVSLFQDAHIYISTHRSEGFGMHILEALATGTPTISLTKSGEYDFGKQYIVPIKSAGEEEIDYSPYNHGVLPTIWHIPDVDSIVRNINNIITEYSCYRQTNKTCSAFIHKKYSWSNVVDILEKIIKKYKLIN